MRGIGLVFNIYVANKVGAEAIGIFSLIMSVYNFAITVATSGIGIACTCIVSISFEELKYNKEIVAIIFTLVSKICEIALLYGFSTEEKYPLITEETAISGNPTEIR